MKRIVKQKLNLFKAIVLPVLTAGFSLGISTRSVAAVTIKYDLNGVAPTVYTSENAKAVADVTPDFDNMTFTGWNTQPDGSGTSYKAGDSIGDDATLYAQWQDGTHLKDWTKSSTGGDKGEAKGDDNPVAPIEPAKPTDKPDAKGDNDNAGMSDGKSSGKSDNDNKASGVIGADDSWSGSSNGTTDDGPSASSNQNIDGASNFDTNANSSAEVNTLLPSPRSGAYGFAGSSAG